MGVPRGGGHGVVEGDERGGRLGRPGDRRGFLFRGVGGKRRGVGGAGEGVGFLGDLSLFGGEGGEGVFVERGGGGGGGGPLGAEVDLNLAELFEAHGLVAQAGGVVLEAGGLVL